MTGVQIAALATLVVATCAIVWVTRGPFLRQRRERLLGSAMSAFAASKASLESLFFQLAAQSGKPRGLIWTGVEFRDEIRFGRDKQTGLIAAFVGVNIRFEAIPGGDMEDVAAVSNIRDATALFHFERGQWGTGGKALFNVDPTAALLRLQGQFEPLSLPASTDATSSPSI